MATSVADLYTQVLGRAPDAAGLAYWESMFGSTVDPAELATFKSVAAVTEPTATPTATVTPSTAAAAPTSYLEQVKSQLTPEQYQQLVAPLMFTANENFGGNVQDYQAQLVTPLDTSKLNFPKQVDANTAGVRQIADGFISTEPTMVNGVPVYAKYDPSGQLAAYQGDNKSATTWTNGENRLVGNWDPSGKAAPISIGSQTGLFNTGYHWNDIRDNLEAAAVVAGNYFLPGSSMLTSQLVTQGAQENLNTDAGRLANIAAGAAGGLSGNTANYGKIGEAAGITSAPTSSLTAEQLATANATSDPIAAANAMKGWTIADIPYLQSIGASAELISLAEANNANLSSASGGGPSGGTVTPVTGGTTNPLSNLTPSQITTLAKAGINVAGILGAGAAVGGIAGGIGGGSAGGGMLTQQDRSGVSSGSAQYSPEYYQAIQAKYNQMMPQQPRDVTTDLKSWYETKYAPKVTQ